MGRGPVFGSSENELAQVLIPGPCFGLAQGRVQVATTMLDPERAQVRVPISALCTNVCQGAAVRNAVQSYHAGTKGTTCQVHIVVTFVLFCLQALQARRPTISDLLNFRLQLRIGQWPCRPIRSSSITGRTTRTLGTSSWLLRVGFRIMFPGSSKLVH